MAGLLIAVAVAYWLLFGLLVRSAGYDDVISTLAAQSILDHGYPRLPSGFVYHRSYLHHYALAVSLWTFGVNNFALMLPSLVFAIGSLGLVYKISSRILKLPWIGVAAIGILPVLQQFTWYATGPRMYMALMFFTLLGIYAAWKGYIEKVTKFQGLTFIAVAAAIFSHEAGVVSATAIAGAVLVVLLSKPRQANTIRFGISPLFLSGIAILGFLAWFVTLYQPTPFPTVVLHGGTPPDRLGFNFNYIFWGMHLGHLEEVFPFALPFVMIGLLAARFIGGPRGAIYLLSVWLFAVGIVGFLIRDVGGPRLFLFVAPLYVIIALLGLWVVIRFMRPVRPLIAGAIMVIILLGGGISAMLGILQANAPYERGSSGLQFISEAVVNKGQLGELAARAFGPPSATYTLGWIQDKPQAQEDYVRLKRLIKDRDLIAAENAMQAYTLLGRVDAYVRLRKLGNGELVKYAAEKDEYLGIPFIGGTDELLALKQGEGKVWVIIDDGSKLSAELRRALDTYFLRDETFKQIKVFVTN